MSALKEIQVGKVTVKILPDDDCHQDCPITDLGESDGVIFASFERRSTLKDHNPFSTPKEAQEFAKKRGWEIFNLRKYSHSNDAYSIRNSYPFNDRWDSGQVGYVLVNAKDFPDTTTPQEIAEGLCKSVTTWVNGWYYGFVIEDEDGNTLDSCWGFDDADYCEEEAKSIAKFHADIADEEAARDEEEARPDLYGATNDQ